MAIQTLKSCLFCQETRIVGARHLLTRRALSSVIQLPICASQTESRFLRIDLQEERRTKAAMYMGRAAAAVEESNHKQMLGGAEREAERRQRVAR